MKNIPYGGLRLQVVYMSKRQNIPLVDAVGFYFNTPEILFHIPEPRYPKSFHLSN